MNLQLPDLGPIMPELYMTILALVLLLADLFLKKKEALAALSIVGVGVVAFTLIGSSGVTFGGMFISDGYSSFFKTIFFINLILSVLISIKYIGIERVNFGEYYSLIALSTLGMMIMASAADLIVLYLGLELMALSTYILAGFIRHDIKSNEAALKYFLLGAFSSAFLLYGISIIYGLTGTTDIKAIASYISEKGLVGNPALTLSMTLFAAAFGFKIAAVPFHMWAPDVYEGAPTSITAFMSVGPKAAGFAAFLRIFMTAFGSTHYEWQKIIYVLAVLTMTIGNVVAIAQTNIKRMLAYSSIAHAGYLLIALVAANNMGVSGTLFYILAYIFM